MELIDRPAYRELLESWFRLKQTDLVKIVTGARRCGKSKLFTLFQESLSANHAVQSGQIININLEDPLTAKEIGLITNETDMLESYETLLDFILKKLNPKTMNYVFIDEIQRLLNWHHAANGLRLRSNVDLYLTGSNAYMFSSDLANAFGGRYIEIKMRPLSFKEYVSAFRKNFIKLDEPRADTGILGAGELFALYEKYITESGFPQTLEFNGSRQNINDYLTDTVYRNTIQKDIVKRFGISDFTRLDNVVRYLFDNVGNETSLRGIERGLKADGRNISVPTIDNYVKGLLDSYLMYKCNKYDIKGKSILNSDAKYYAVDLGLRAAILKQEGADKGRVLENIVYLELLNRGYEVCVGKVKTKTITHAGTKEKKTVEIDFVARKPEGITEYYQVAWLVLNDNPETLRRELASLEEIRDNFPKYLLSMDYGSGTFDGIKRLNVLQWLIE